MQQRAHRNRTGPGLGTFLVVGGAAFFVVFGMGLYRPGASLSPLDVLQRLSWQFSKLQSADFGLPVLGRRGPIPSPAATPPTRPDTSYVVSRGDTLSVIAARFGLDAATLAAHNRLRDPDRLEVGQRLAIPTGVAPSEPAVLPSVASPPPATAARGSLVELDALLAMAEEELRAARFERALHTIEAIERLLGPDGDGESTDRAVRRARMEVARATAYAAVGHHQQVQNALSRALAADPDLDLDPAATSPKLLQALDLARQTRDAGPSS